MILRTVRKRSFGDIRPSDTAIPIEYNDHDYAREVLRLEEGQTEALLDKSLAKQAEELVISITRPRTANEGFPSSLCESTATAASEHARTASTGSQESSSTGMTSAVSNGETGIRNVVKKKKGTYSKRRRSLSFSEYDKFVSQTEAKDFPQTTLPVPVGQSISVSSRPSYANLKGVIRSSLRLQKRKSSRTNLSSCVCCRDDFKKSKALIRLPCLHSYCQTCLRVLITQATNDEWKMPPKCCGQAIPGNVIISILNKEEQQAFMRSVLEFSTPWESRIFCPNTACGVFIPKPNKIDPRQPFEVICKTCGTKACSICKGAAHGVGQDCPSDWELEAVLEMGERSGWRRCYKCRTLVELSQGCSHITCRCKAQFCYICGAVWDHVVGCPNYCNGEEELERRRLAEEARIAELEAEKTAKEEAERLEAAEKVEAEKRTRESRELRSLQAQQINERDRFIGFNRKMRWMMWTRHGEAKLAIWDRYGELENKMRERHARTACHLEDRQVAAEMELHGMLKQSERSVQIRLKHMEAYCAGLGRNANGFNPARVVTERDLRELGQQYSIRDDLERLHKSKINVMRDKQSKQMEQLLARQEEELDKLGIKQNEELEELAEVFSAEQEGLLRVFASRRERLRWRWVISEEVLRRKLEIENGGSRFAPLGEVEWPLRSVERVVDEELGACC